MVLRDKSFLLDVASLFYIIKDKEYVLNAKYISHTGSGNHILVILQRKQT